MSTQVEQTARDMGWKPKEEFRGEEGKWVDAETFVNRGENFIPILRANNRKLEDQLNDTRTRLETTNSLLQASQEAIAELKKFHTESTVRQVAEAKKALLTQLKEAKEAGDVEAEVRLTDELADVREAQRTAEAAPPAAAPAPKPPPQEDPVFTAWKEENPWFSDKPRLRALALGVAEEIRTANPNLTGKKFFEKVSEEMREYTHPESDLPTSKVSGGRPNGNGSAGTSPKTRGFSDLPQEAKDACERQGKKLVGAGRAFKTSAEWQSHYVEQYFAGESA